MISIRSWKFATSWKSFHTSTRQTTLRPICRKAITAAFSTTATTNDPTSKPRFKDFQPHDLTRARQMVREYRSLKYQELRSLHDAVKPYLQLINDPHLTNCIQYNRSSLFQHYSTKAVEKQVESLRSTFTFTSVTFYNFHPMTQEQYDLIKTSFKQKITNLNPWIRGTLIMAKNEGINAQFFVPSTLLPSFTDTLYSIDSSIFPKDMYNYGKEVKINSLTSNQLLAKVEIYHFLKDVEFLFLHADRVNKINPSTIIEEKLNLSNGKLPNNAIAPPSKWLLPEQIGQERLLERNNLFDGNLDYSGKPLSQDEKQKIGLIKADLRRLLPVLYKQIIADLYESMPLSKLIIKEKAQLLTDGLLSFPHPPPSDSKNDTSSSSSLSSSSSSKKYVDSSIDWDDAGPELSPEEWHREISQKMNSSKVLEFFKENTSSSSSSSSTKEDIPLLLDCRNDYESTQGTFTSAIPLNTTIFKETFPLLDNLLKDVPKNQRILTFCTGGVRCVKVNAYLKQKLGFENIGRLEKGIVAYENWAKEQEQQHQHQHQQQQKQKQEELCKEKQFEEHQSEGKVSLAPSHSSSSSSFRSIWVGTNFVFDRRRNHFDD